ncbi:MAG TPA: two-component regulator propeller domain-containing protein [Bryobacteraceae bacterium]|nr:two-component regulator propeller domain-containing protein [Bryobacteraceae bacterium]
MQCRNPPDFPWPNTRRAAQLCCWLAIFCSAALAGDQYQFEVWTADNGLPQNIIRDIRQTPDGYLWLATLDGLARFDGVRFTVFNKTNSPGIHSTRFTSLFEDRDGDLWLGTEGSGVTCFHHGRFVTYTTQQGLPHNFVRAITGDKSGNLWVLSHDSIAQWQAAAGRFADVTPKDLKIPFDTFLWEGGGFWGADDTRLHGFVEGRFVTYQLPPWLPGRSIWGVAIAQNGVMWLETSDGMHATIVNGNVQRQAPEATLTYLDARGNSWTMGVGQRLIRDMNCSQSGHTQKIPFSALREDGEGNLWLATDGQGLYQVRRQVITAYSKEQGLIDRDVYPVYQDRAGALWMGAWPGGLTCFQDGKFSSYTTKDGLASRLVTALYEDRGGRLWVAAHGGLRVFQDGRFLDPHGPAIPNRAVIQAIHQDGEGTYWFGTSLGLVRYKDGVSKLLTDQDGLAGEDVRVIMDGSAGDLWIGGYGGLTRLRAGQFKRWTERDGLPSDMVRALYRDSDGIIWIGTYDGGLGRFQDGKFTRYTTSEGLFNNGVFQILEDARGNFWMSSNRGIYRVSKRDLNEFAAGAHTGITSVAYGRSDGMLNVECNGGFSPAGVKARDGKLWFPTQDGVAVIDPEAVPSNRRPPPVVIESFLLDRVPTPLAGSLRIAPDKTNFEIQYTALSFIDSQQIRFKYKLEALDSGWVDAGARRAAYYSHVPPGDYVFRVIARNSDGAWNTEGSSLEMTVLAPY